ncbi:DUF1876 domain-containing protein [Nonomuraea sp. NPDC004354]
MATGVVTVLTTAKDGRSEWLAAGQALQRVLLYACAYGVSAAFHTQALEVPLLREFLREELCGGARRARSTRSPPCAWAAGGAGRDLRRRTRGLSPLGSRLAAGVDGSEVSIAESRHLAEESGTMKAKQWTVQIYIAEDGDDTTAKAELITREGTHLSGTGRARRNPTDPSIPEIGDELAASRALADLADKLAVVTQRDIARFVDAPMPKWSW